jgi:hypothetical protein
MFLCPEYWDTFYIFLHAYLFLSDVFQHLPPQSSTRHWEQNQFRQHCVRECDPMYKVRKPGNPFMCECEVFTAVLLKIQIFSDVTACSTGLLDSEDEGSGILRNVCNVLRCYTTYYPKSLDLSLLSVLYHH